ncbi:MAG: putative glycoside hydrolase, partial [bacterium]
MAEKREKRWAYCIMVAHFLFLSGAVFAHECPEGRVLVCGTVLPSDPPPLQGDRFPRLGGMKIGTPQNYDSPAIQQGLAKLDVVVVGFGARFPVATMEEIIKDIIRLNPKIKLYDYVIIDSIHKSNPTLSDIRAMAAERNWYLTSDDGARVSHEGDGGWAGNISIPAYTEWMARRYHAKKWEDIPSLTGVFVDNVFWRPRVTGNWQGGAPGYRRGYVHHFTTLRALMPTKPVIGNIGDWGRPEAVVPEYNGVLDGGYLEHYIGASWSRETAGTTAMMDSYRKVASKVGETLIFNMRGNATDYKTFRYGLASALVGGDAYFDFSAEGEGSIYNPKVSWFDEYDLAGQGTSKWLG